MKLTLGNHKYGLKKTTGGERYITKEFSKKGFEKWKKGEIKHGSGIISLSAKSKALKT